MNENVHRTIANIEKVVTTHVHLNKTPEHIESVATPKFRAENIKFDCNPDEIPNKKIVLPEINSHKVVFLLNDKIKNAYIKK